LRTDITEQTCLPHCGQPQQACHAREHLSDAVSSVALGISAKAAQASPRRMCPLGPMASCQSEDCCLAIWAAYKSKGCLGLMLCLPQMTIPGPAGLSPAGPHPGRVKLRRAGKGDINVLCPTFFARYPPSQSLTLPRRERRTMDVSANEHAITRNGAGRMPPRSPGGGGGCGAAAGSGRTAREGRWARLRAAWGMNLLLVCPLPSLKATGRPHSREFLAVRGRH
jgi:hypothetical protein